MSWFLRSHEWANGDSPIAKKLLRECSCVLFVRMGRGDFLCCGYCHTKQEENKQQQQLQEDWGLVELKLNLCNWEELQNCSDFVTMVSANNNDDDDAPLQQAEEEEEGKKVSLSSMVLQGNMVGALFAAVAHLPEGKRSVETSIQLLQQALEEEGEEDSRIAKRMNALLDTMKKNTL